MEIRDARCTNCGASLKVEPQKMITTCGYCNSSVMISDAIELALVEVDRTKDIKKYRENLEKAVVLNQIEEMKRLSEKIRDIIPEDFEASYFFSYSMQAQGKAHFLRDFYTHQKPGTEEAIKRVIEHIYSQSDLNDFERIKDFLKRVSPESLTMYQKVHQERIQVEDLYAPVPRDVFICFSSYNHEIAEATMKHLEKEGFTCWISTRNLRPDDSENYWKDIKTAIRNARLVLVISSQQAMLSKDVQEELEISQKEKKRIIEYKIDSAVHTVLFKHVFNGVKWIDGTQEPLGSIKKISTRVFEELQTIDKIVYTPQVSQEASPQSWVRKILLPLFIFIFLGATGILLASSGVLSPEAYTVDFIGHDGITIETLEVTSRDVITYPEEPSRVGYTFTGWSDERTSTDRNITIRPVFEINTYEVQFLDTDGSVLSTVQVNHGSEPTPPTVATPEGSRFVGWTPSLQSITRNQTFRAVYETMTFRVRFNDHTGSLLREETVRYGENATSPVAQREGYTFEGWDQLIENITANLVVNPIYRIITFTVRFIDDDDTVISEQTVEYNQDAPLPREPMKEGSIFTGWDQSNRNIRSNRDIRAQFSERLLTVTFRDFDNRVIETYRVDFGDSSPEPVSPSRPGHIFTGWSQNFDAVTTNLNVIAQYRIDDRGDINTNNDSSNDSGSSSNDTTNDSSSNDENVQVDNRILIQFNSLGGTSVESQRLDQGSFVQEPSNIQRSGFTLEGWYTDFSNGNVAGQKWNFTQNQVITAIILYANWLSVPPQNNTESNQTNNVNQQLQSAGYKTVVNTIPPSGRKSLFHWMSDDVFDLANTAKSLINKYLSNEVTDTDWIEDRFMNGLSYRVTSMDNNQTHLEVFIPKLEPLNGGTSNGPGTFVFYIGASYGKYYSIMKSNNPNQPMVEVIAVETIIWDERSTYFDSSFARTTKDDLPSSKLRFIDETFYEYYHIDQFAWQNFALITYDQSGNFNMNALRGRVNSVSTSGYRINKNNGVYYSYSGGGSVSNMSLSNNQKENIISYQNINSSRISLTINVSALSGWLALGGNHNDGEKAAILTQQELFEFSTSSWFANSVSEFIPGVKIALVPGSSSSGIDGSSVDQFSEPMLIMEINNTNFLHGQDKIFEVLDLLGLEFKIGNSVIIEAVENFIPISSNYLGEISYLNINQALGQNGYLLLNAMRQSLNFEAFQNFVNSYDFDLYQWYEVSFETNGGNKIDSRFIHNSRFGHIESPVRANYIFEGWYYDPDFLQTYDSSAVINQDTVLYAKWRLEP